MLRRKGPWAVPPGKSWPDPPLVEVVDLIDFSVPPFAEDRLHEATITLPSTPSSKPYMAKRVDSGTAAFHPGESRGGEVAANPRAALAPTMVAAEVNSFPSFGAHTADVVPATEHSSSELSLSLPPLWKRIASYQCVLKW